LDLPPSSGGKWRGRTYFLMERLEREILYHTTEEIKSSLPNIHLKMGTNTFTEGVGYLLRRYAMSRMSNTSVTISQILANVWQFQHHNEGLF
jgi:hypothetical protein